MLETLAAPTELVSRFCHKPKNTLGRTDIVTELVNYYHGCVLTAADLFQELRNLPIDDKTFYRENDWSRDECVSELLLLAEELVRVAPSASRPLGFLGVLAMTLSSLGWSETQNGQMNGELGREQEEDKQWMRVACLVGEGQGADRLSKNEKLQLPPQQAAVRRLLLEMYFSSSLPWWTCEDCLCAKGHMKLHKLGSTSVIIEVRECNHTKRGTPDNYALKLVIPPFLRIAEISRETEGYYGTYRLNERDAMSFQSLVQIQGSGPGWILMDFVAGPTLAEVCTWAQSGKLDEDAGVRKRRTRLFPNIRSELKDRAMQAVSEDVVEAATDEIDLSAMSEVAYALCRALAQNRAAGEDRLHGDLSPANIIVKSGYRSVDRPGARAYYLDRPELVLVDFGPNYLFTRGAAVGDEAKAPFIAPEIRDDAPQQRSDAYSLAQILIFVGGQYPGPGGIVPDKFYSEYPSLAELLEDLSDPDPQTRLSVFDGDVQYAALERILQFELDVCARARRSRARPRTLLTAALSELVPPVKGEPRRQVRRFFGIKNWPGLERDAKLLKSVGIDDSRRASLADGPPICLSATRSVNQASGEAEPFRYRTNRQRIALELAAWSCAAAVCASVALFFASWWLFRTIPFAAFPPPLDRLAMVFNSPAYLYDYVDRLNISGPPTISVDQFCIRLATVSYALLHAKLYQGVYARVQLANTTQVGSLRWASLFAQTWMRLLPFLGATLVLWVTLRDIAAWPIAVIVGQTLTFLGNFAVFSYVSGALNAGTRRLRTVPSPYTQIAGYASVSSWVSGSLFEAIVCLTVGLLIYFGHLSDIWLYASMIAALNFFLVIVKCGLDAPSIRVALHRASFAGRRLGRRSGI